MATIKIPVKAGLSNKTKTHTKSEDPFSALGKVKGDKPASSLVPFIDKLSIVVKPSCSYEAAQIHQAIIGSIDDFSFLTPINPAKGFQFAKRINLQGIRHRPILHYRFFDKETVKVRLEFNPSKLGLHGLTALHGQLKSLMNDGWEYVIANGTLTRLDIAVDLPNVRMDDLHLVPPQKTMRRDWSKNGKLETVTLGGKKSSQTLLYNKKAQQIAVGKEWEGPTLVRIERRLKGLGPLKLSGLSAFKNPFAGVALLQGLPSPSSDIKANPWSMFSDCVRCRGLDNALALLPVATKARYRKYLKEHKALWWDADSIWSNWKDYLISMPLNDQGYFSALP